MFCDKVMGILGNELLHRRKITTHSSRIADFPLFLRGSSYLEQPGSRKKFSAHLVPNRKADIDSVA